MDQSITIKDTIYTYNADAVSSGKNGDSFIACNKDIRVFIKKVAVGRIEDKNALLERLSTFYETINSFGKGLAKTIAFELKNNTLYIVREFTEGIDLKTYQKKKKPDNRESISIMKKVLKSLEFLHKHEILHCDIKPANIIVADSENDNKDVILVDFEQAIWEGQCLLPNRRVSFSLIYSSPEQLLRRIKMIGAHSDIFSCGITLYELISRKPAFHHSHPEFLMNLQISYPLKYIKRINEAVFICIEKATHRKAFPLPLRRMKKEDRNKVLEEGIEGRYQNCGEFINTLNTISIPQKSKNQFMDWLYLK